MKKIGLIGGLGPEATVEYYKEIIKKFNLLNKDVSLNYPEMIIYSVNISKLIDFMEKKEYSNAVQYISKSIASLKDAGAEFGAITANTPHLLFDEIQKKSELPLISIVDAVRKEAQKLQLKKVGLIGTKFTMKASFYSDAFAKDGMEVHVPDNNHIEVINHKLFTEMELGIFKPETRELILGIVQQMKNKQGIDSIILGCTEFPIMFTNDAYFGIPFLNTTRIHVEEIVRQCLEN
jgi:aspartate racemase